MRDVRQAAPGDQVAPFEFPQVEGLLVGTDAGAAPMPTAGQLARLHKQAYAEGYASGDARGYAEGRERAEAAARERGAILDRVLAELGQPLAELDEQLVESVAQLALLIARHLVRRELKTAPDEVVGVVREALRHLPIADRGVAVHLNPEDIDIVREALALGGDTSRWRLEPDPLITRGGCTVETASSRIDASVETRLAALASAMFGGERDGDRSA